MSLSTAPHSIEPKRYVIELKHTADREAHYLDLQQFDDRVDVHLDFDHTIFNAYAATIHSTVFDDPLFQLGPHSNIESIREDQEMSLCTVTWKREVPSWGLARINRDSKPDANGPWKYHYDDELETGKDINVYVIDTGIYSSHTDFKETDGTRVMKSWHWKKLEEGDKNGHGTHVAGIIGGTTHGVAPKVTLYDVKAFDDLGKAYGSVVTKALDHVLKEGKKPGIVNMSFEGGNDEGQKRYIEQLTTAGFHVVTAAGNGGVDAKATTPANASTAITVGATDDQDSMWVSSNTGKCVDLLAPGVKIPSCGIATDNTFVEKTGTSMAAPHVSGIIASMLSLTPANAKWSPKDVKDILIALSTADKVQNLGAETENRLARGCLHTKGSIQVINTQTGRVSIIGSGPIVNTDEDMTKDESDHMVVTSTHRSATARYKKKDVKKDKSNVVSHLAFVSPTRKITFSLGGGPTKYDGSTKDDSTTFTVGMDFGSIHEKIQGISSTTVQFNDRVLQDEGF
ncbi:peptidase S8/S53 domain-containing protein [Mycena haematopus]|nr:peptidase S8/S53 domain-containing protein [Mycena haematopus]